MCALMCVLGADNVVSIVAVSGTNACMVRECMDKRRGEGEMRVIPGVQEKDDCKRRERSRSRPRSSAATRFGGRRRRRWTDGDDAFLGHEIGIGVVHHL